jgi:hypothetical protein
MATVKRGNWTEERREVLKNHTGAEIDADIMRIQAENPDKGITAEAFREKMRRMEEAETAARRAETVGA